MASHSRRPLSFVVALAVTGALLGPSTVAWAHERPAVATRVTAPDAVPVAAVTAVSVAPAVLAAQADGVSGARAAVPAMPSPAAGVGTALFLTLLLGATLLAPRRVRIAALVLVLAVIAVEESVHSVHHLADQRAAAHCAVAAASAHVQGATEPDVVPAVWVPIPTGGVVGVEPDQLGSRSLRPHEGRAPPSA
jgi:hypothetical protein